MAEVTTHTLGNRVQIPVRIRAPDGVSRVYAEFRLLVARTLGPGSLDPDRSFTLRGRGAGRVEDTVELEGSVAEEFTPGEYLCVALHVYDELGRVETIRAPYPSRILRVVKSGLEDSKAPVEFLGWGQE